MEQKYRVLARRYRPQKFHDVVGQEVAVTTLKNALKFDKIAHAYLFSGSRGVGKTTLARLFAKALNCQDLQEGFEPCDKCPSCLDILNGQSLDVIEIDGASNRGIDDIREINETVGYAPSHGKYKIYIIDEVHMLTKEAFNALLKTLEEPPEKAKFFFATTEPHKVLPTIISRCQRFDLGRIHLSQIVAKLEEIAKDLGREVSTEALFLIAEFSEGSLRDAESLFDQILCFANEKVTEERVRESLGLVSKDAFFSLDKAFSEEKSAFAFELVQKLYLSGKDFNHFLSELTQHYRILSILKTAPDEAPPLAPETLSHYRTSAELYSAPQALYALEYLLKMEPQFSKSSFPRISLESILLHLIRSKHRLPLEVLVRKLTELEQKLLSNEEIEPPTQPAAPPAPKVMAPPEPEKPLPLPEAPVTAPLPKLEPVPFTPQPKAAPTPKKVEAPPPKIEEPLPDGKHPSHYDTIMRFAAIELEGTLKKE